jgi:arabinose-5-phosphate isomerase
MAEPKLDIDETPESPGARLLIESALRTLETEASGISALAAAINGALAQPIVAAVEMIRAARGRLIVTGMGKSGHIGRKIAATFASTGTPAFFVHPGEASHGDLGMITPDDVIMALSWSGETVELKDLINYSRRFRINLIGITASAESALAEAADVALVLPQVREACPHNLAPTTSSLMQLALGDVLAVALLESRGFTAFDFRAFHPSGKLGAMLGFVRDIMQTGDAVTQMSRRGSGYAAGCVGITDHDGKLVGIITDGDLRRNMRPDLLDLAVDAIMTRDPKTVAPAQLVSEAMEMLNTSKVSVLLVVENARAVGIVHFHHLLRAGVA